MSFLLLQALAVILGGAGVLWIARHALKTQGASERLPAWRDAAARYGLRVVEITSDGLTARKGSVEVRIASSPHPEYSWRIVVVGPWPPGFHSVRLRREPRFPMTQVHEIEIGDEVFDSAFLLEGPLRLVCSLLDAETRRLLVRANAESRLEIDRGELRADVSYYRLVEVLPLLVDIGERFAQPLDVAQRLAENALRHPNADMRLRNLVLLVRECAWDGRTVETLRKACADASPEVRLRAATELGAEARHVLVDLAEYCADDEVSAQAVSSLGRELPFERTEAVLTSSLRWGRRKTALACLEVLTKHGDAAVEVLARAMASEEGELAVAAVEALGITGCAAAEPALIEALKREWTDLRRPAASALGRVGSAEAILPLKEAAGRSTDPEVRGAIRQAIAEIQARLPGASPGQLSLAGAESGQLSIADSEAGRLSMATDAAGRVSLAPAERDRVERRTG